MTNLSVVFCSSLFRITLMASDYPLCHYDISLNNFCSPKKQLKYLGRQGKIFIFQIFFEKKQIISITKNIPQDVSMYMRLEHKCPICVIRRGYPETKKCPNSSFSNNFCHWNLNNKKTFLFCF